MLNRTRYLVFTALFFILMFNIGCAFSGKHYRDGTGILKTESRSAEGVRK